MLVVFLVVISSGVATLARASSLVAMTNGEQTAVDVPNAILKCQGQKASYGKTDPVKFTVENTSDQKAWANIRVQRLNGSRWSDVIPYVGADIATKSAKVEVFVRHQRRKLVWNDIATPSVYRAETGAYRIIAEFYDPKTLNSITEVELFKFDMR